MYLKATRPLCGRQEEIYVGMACGIEHHMEKVVAEAYVRCKSTSGVFPMAIQSSEDPVVAGEYDGPVWVHSEISFHGHWHKDRSVNML